MTGALFNVLMDLVVVVLLSMTIAYCWNLNRRIKVLQDSKSELAQLLKHFDESTQRASESIIALQTASKKIGENIQFRIDKANYLLDDLSFMIERGNKLANQLEASFAVNRARTRVMSENAPAQDAVAPVGEENIVAPEPVLMEKPPAEKPAARAREKTTASLEAVLERVMVRGKSDEEEAPARGRPPQTRVRSKSEQELLDMIKAGIKG